MTYIKEVNGFKIEVPRGLCSVVDRIIPNTVEVRRGTLLALYTQGNGQSNCSFKIITDKK